jgi:hypothetical protein
MIDPEADCHVHLEYLMIELRFHFDKNAGCLKPEAGSPVPAIQDAGRNRIFRTDPDTSGTILKPAFMP